LTPESETHSITLSPRVSSTVGIILLPGDATNPRGLPRRQTILKPPGGDNENSISYCPCRIGNKLCFAGLCPTIEHAWPQLPQPLVALAKKVDDAYNNGDPAALVARYTNNGVLVMATGQMSWAGERLEKISLEVSRAISAIANP